MTEHFALGIAVVTVLMVVGYFAYTVYASRKHTRDIIRLARAPLGLPADR